MSNVQCLWRLFDFADLRAQSAGLSTVNSHKGDIIAGAVSITSPIRTMSSIGRIVGTTCRSYARAAVQSIYSSNVQTTKPTSLTKWTTGASSSLNGWTITIWEGVIWVVHNWTNIIRMSLGWTWATFLKIVSLAGLDVWPINDNVRVAIGSGLFVPITWIYILQNFISDSNVYAERALSQVLYAWK